MRGAVVGSVFRKMLKMDTASSTYSSGELTNLVSVDAQNVLEFGCYIHFIWATILQVCFESFKWMHAVKEGDCFLFCCVMI